jgi:hypothetical protein
MTTTSPDLQTLRAALDREECNHDEHDEVVEAEIDSERFRHEGELCELLWQRRYSDLPNLTLTPFVDEPLRDLLTYIVNRLILVRHGDPFDPGASIAVLASITEEIDGRLPDAVAMARDEGYSWDRVADRLAATTSQARRDYAHIMPLLRSKYRHRAIP